MQVFKIYQMRWVNEEKSIVSLVADTDTGAQEQIFTPYSAESIIWNEVLSFPPEQIEPMEIPTLEVLDNIEL